MIAVALLLAAGAIYFSLRHAWWRPDLPEDFPRILMYHMVSPHRPGCRYNRLRVKPEDFDRQVAWLLRSGWAILTVSELMEGGRSSGKTAVLTFDDGYEDNYRNAFPVLKKYGVKATVYLVVNRNGAWARDRDSGAVAPELNQEPMLTDAQVAEMAASGLVEFGSHTMSHADLRQLDEAGRREEIGQSRAEITRRYGIPCRTFAYPFGFFDTACRDMVREAGYTSAVSTLAGVDALARQDPWALKRVAVSGRQSLLDFKLKLHKGRNR